MSQHRPARAARGDAVRDGGFTLVEVVVAVVLLGLVTTAVLPFFLQSLTKGAGLQERQAGVAVANSAMEQARSVVATQATLGGSAVVTGLVRGRAEADVRAQWAAAGESTAATTPRWDPAPASAPLNARVTPGAPDHPTNAVIPLRRTDTISSVTYTSATLIGTCRRPRADPAAACAASGTGTPPAGTVELVRLVVVTTWAPLNGGACPTDGCRYRLASLVDPTVDPLWITGAGEVVDDTATVRAGQSVDVPVLANDSVYVTANSSPVTLRGTVPSGASALPSGQVRYAAPTSAAGTTTVITYSVRNAAGSETGQATVTITVTA